MQSPTERNPPQPPQPPPRPNGGAAEEGAARPQQANDFAFQLLEIQAAAQQAMQAEESRRLLELHEGNGRQNEAIQQQANQAIANVAAAAAASNPASFNRTRAAIQQGIQNANPNNNDMNEPARPAAEE